MYNCNNERVKLEYARAYVLVQKYGNLYPVCDALWKGTIFKDLYRPYKNGYKC